MSSKDKINDWLVHVGACVTMYSYMPVSNLLPTCVLYTGRIWLDNVNCNSGDEVLEDCSFRPWGQNNCDHGDDVGVICRPSELFHL